MLPRLIGGRETEVGCTQDLRPGTQRTSFLSFIELIVITPRIEFASGVNGAAPDQAPGAGDVDSRSRVDDMFKYRQINC
jgi:hypothetical protein